MIILLLCRSITGFVAMSSTCCWMEPTGQLARLTKSVGNHGDEPVTHAEP